MQTKLKSEALAPTQRSRRHLLQLAIGAASMLAFAGVHAQRVPILMQIWKDPNCGCCQDWIAHLEQNGFVTSVVGENNTVARARLGMPEKYASCHTALVQGYVIEGHVPAADIHKLLKAKPLALGLTVPGMPIGSPGMDGPAYGGRRDAYQVLLIQKNGAEKIFNSYS